MSVHYTMYIYCKCVQKSMYIMYVAYMCIFIYKHTVSPLSPQGSTIMTYPNYP